MTVTGLIVLIAVLSVIRGVFLLFPDIRVRPFWVKLFLTAVVAAIAIWTARTPSLPVEMGEPPPPVPMRYVVICGLALVGILLLPGGHDPLSRSAPVEGGAESAEPPLPGGDASAAVGEDLGEPPPQSVSRPPAGPALTRGVWTEAQKKTMLEYIDSVIVAGVTALFLIVYLVRSFYIPSESMVPTLQVDDMILVDELAYRIYKPGRGDIVVFRPPEKANSEGKDFIKRIVAVEGDTVHVKNDITYINGIPIDEPYRNPELNPLEAPSHYEPLTVPPGQVFCMGDNRSKSDDSRYWGTLPVENIIGKAFVIFYPFDRAGRLH